jgi:hypothetical protein
MLGLLIFFFQLEKVYNPQNAEDDMIEMEEERLRMREHVMSEVCCKVKACPSLPLVKFLQ